jgi:ABC-type transporter Mla MlaB component
MRRSGGRRGPDVNVKQGAPDMTIAGPPIKSLTVHVTPSGTDRLVIAVTGDLDAFTIDELSRQIVDLLGESAPATVELDLAGVAFIDAAATVRLRELHALATTTGCVLSISAATQFAWWLFHTLGLNAVFPAPARHRWASEPGT